MSNENFYEAAVRHWVDGRVLEQEEEYDNAVCMQGFAAECALKTILRKGRSIKEIRNYSHFGEELFQDIEMMLLADLGLAAIIDPASGLRLSQNSLPAILFQNHPARRYYKDEIYSKEDAVNCRRAADSLIREISRLYLDGYIGEDEG
ncbi:hypothetical protein AALA00_00270 [Lachnospiraceae bacterium 46-15]